jgi:hypothetical protein
VGAAVLTPSYIMKKSESSSPKGPNVSATGQPEGLLMVTAQSTLGGYTPPGAGGAASVVTRVNRDVEMFRLEARLEHLHERGYGGEGYGGGGGGGMGGWRCSAGCSGTLTVTYIDPRKQTCACTTAAMAKVTATVTATAADVPWRNHRHQQP